MESLTSNSLYPEEHLSLLLNLRKLRLSLKRVSINEYALKISITSVKKRLELLEESIKILKLSPGDPIVEVIAQYRQLIEIYK